MSEKKKRPPFWRVNERAKFDAMQMSLDEIQARVLTPKEVNDFSVGFPKEWRKNSMEWLYKNLGLKSDKVPEGSGAGFVQSPFSSIYTTTYGVPTISDLQKYRKMIRSQPDIQQAIQLQTTMAIGKGFHITYPDKKIEEYLNKFVDDINMLQSMLVLCFDAIGYGTGYAEIQWSDKVMVKEKVYEHASEQLTTSEVYTAGLDGKVKKSTLEFDGASGKENSDDVSIIKRKPKEDESPTIYGLKCLDPIYIKVRQDSFGNQFGFTQWMTSPPVFIANENMVCIRYRPTSIGMEQAYGVSQLQTLIKNYDLLDLFENDASTWMHLRAVPPLIAKGGADPQHPYSTTQMNDLISKLAARTSATLLAVKSDVDIQELQGVARNLNINWYLEYLLTKRYQALGVPPVLMGVPEGTNRATGEVVFQDFITRLQLIQKLMADAIETQVLYPLVRERFGKNDDVKPKIVWKPIVEEDRNMRAQRLIQALQAKAITVNEFREAIGFERIEKPEFDKIDVPPKVPPSNLLSPTKSPEEQGEEEKDPRSPKEKIPPWAKPSPEGVRKKENESLIDQEFRIKKMRLLVEQEQFKEELSGLAKYARFEMKQDDRKVKDIKKEVLSKAEEIINRHVSNAHLYAKMDLLYSKAASEGTEVTQDMMTLTKEDTPLVTKLKKKFLKDFSAILDDMVTEKSEGTI